MDNLMMLDALSRIRRVSKLSQSAVADGMSTTQCRVSQIETGKSPITLDVLTSYVRAIDEGAEIRVCIKTAFREEELIL